MSRRTSYTDILDLVHRSNLLDGIDKGSCIPSLVPDEHLGLRCLLRLDDGVEISVVERQWLLDENVLVLLERQNGLRWMESVDIADQNHVNFGGGDELLGVGCGLGVAPGDFLAAVLESGLRGVAEVGDLKVAGKVVQDVNMAHLERKKRTCQ